MKPNLLFKDPLKNCTINCNLALLLLVFLSVSFFNVAQSRELGSHDKTPYFGDFVCIADSASETDSDDHDATVPYAAIANFGSAFGYVDASYTVNYFTPCYLRPHTRAPPKVSI